MIKLASILSEMLDPSKVGSYQLITPGAKPDGGSDMQPSISGTEEFSDGTTETTYKFDFMNAKNRRMNIEIVMGRERGGAEPNMVISFGVTSRGDDKWKTMTGAGDLKEILGTIIKAVKSVMGSEEINSNDELFAVSYQPADDRRERIYKYFIEKYFPSFRLEVRKIKDPETGEMVPDPRQPAYKTFINRNYQHERPIQSY